MKKYISAFLINALLINICGCYSIGPITKDYSDVENITKVVLNTKASETYTYKKFNVTDQLLKAPNELFFTNYSFQDSNIIIVGKRLNTESLIKDSKHISTDTLIFNVNNLQSINYEQYRSDQTQLLVGGILVVGLIVAIVIAMQNFNPYGDMQLNFH